MTVNKRIVVSFIVATLALPAGAQSMTKRVYKHGDRIAVIGAGAGGLAVVRALVDQGVEPGKITLLEKEPTAGGKVRTVKADGRAFELGAQMIVPGLYQAIENLIAKHGMTSRPMNRGGVFDEKTGLYFQAGIGVDLGFMTELARYTAKYEWSWRVVNEPKGFSRIPPELDKSWPDFVKEQGFERLERSLAPLLGGSGFLRPENPPVAAQVVRMLSPYALWCASKNGIHALNGGGFQELWRLEAADLQKLGVNAMFSTSVRRIVRKSDTIELDLNDGSAVGHLSEFEHVFYTADMAYLPSLLADVSTAEKSLYGRIKHYDYRSFVLRVEGLPNSAETGSSGFTPAMYEMPIGHSLLTVKPYPDSTISIFYTYGEQGLSDAQIIENIKRDLRTFNGEVTEVLASAQWNYFPHVDSDLQSFFNGVLSFEGAGGLWTVGEATSYTATIQVYEHGRDFTKLFLKNEL